MDETPVVDVDAHYIDHLDEILHYLDENDPWRAKFELGHSFEDESGTFSFFPTASSTKASWPLQRQEVRTTEDVVTVMDELGIDQILLIGQQMLRMGYIRGDDKRPLKYTEAYTEFLFENIVSPDDGIYCMIPVVHTDPDYAADLIRRYGNKEAVVGAVFVSSGGDRIPYGNRRFDPVYAACSDHDLPVVFHAEGGNIDDPSLSGFGSAISSHSLGFLMSNMKQLTSVVIQGVPERFPELDFVFQEAGLFYVPTVMYRLDQEYLRKPDEAPLLGRLPSEYMKEFYYGTQPVEQPPKEKYIKYVIEMMGGTDRLLWASDWPHPDYDGTSVIEDLGFLSNQQKRDVLGGNACEVFDI